MDYAYKRNAATHGVEVRHSAKGNRLGQSVRVSGAIYDKVAGDIVKSICDMSSTLPERIAEGVKK